MRTRRVLVTMASAVSCLALAAWLPGCPKGKEGGKGATITGGGGGSQEQTVSEKAKVEFYVMSQCPFGVQVEDGVYPVLQKMGGDIDFQLDFIGKEQNGKLTSMHGQSEVDGNKVQLCAAKVHPDKYMDMVACMNKNMRAIPGNWKGCAKKAQLDVEAIERCFEGEEGTNLLKASFDRARKRRARGSPTMFIGGKPYRGPRSEQAFSRAICDAFPKDKPALCADLPPPVEVPVTIVTDERCKKCRAKFWEKRLKGLFPGAEVTILDYTQDDGKAFYEEQQLDLLPAILFGDEVKKADNYKRIQRFLKPKGEYLSFRSGAKFDPTKEICDNGKDDTGNGLVDCDDPDCKDHEACKEKCDNNKDDTGNGLVDCADPDCKNALICRKEIERKLDVFAMSQCPYGVKALDAMEEVLRYFGDQIDFDVHFIATALPNGKFKALHGQPEVDENIRELCAITHYPKDYKWMDYILCRNKNIRSKDWEKCTGDNGIDPDVIRECFEGEEGKTLLREDIEIAKGLGISASPTWLVNNKHKFQGIDAETVRKNLCQHNEDLKNCDKKLSGPPKRGGGGACK